MRNPLKFLARPEFQYSSLVVGWEDDAGKLGEAVTDYLIQKLGGQPFCEIDPGDYFPLGGVGIEDDLVQFPESRFYACPEHHLVVFRSTPPSFEFFQFFQQVLDVAEQYCNVREIYAVGSLASLNPHTVNRQLLGTFSSAEVKRAFSRIDIDSNVDFETPLGQKPTLNTYLLWAIKNRNLSGINLWVPVPFYLMSVDDPKAQKRVLEFFNKRFGFGFDLSPFDEVIKDQNHRINEARDIYPEIDDYILKLENNLRLTEDENMKLVKLLGEYLKAKRRV